MSDWKKWKRYIIFDRVFQVQAGLILLLVVGLQWEFSVMKRQGHDLRRITAEKALVDRIPELENLLAEKRKPVTASKDPQKPAETGFRVEGVLLRDEGIAALINGEIRTVGDAVGKYEILQISREGVAVADRETGAIEMMAMPEIIPEIKASISQ